HFIELHNTVKLVSLAFLIGSINYIRFLFLTIDGYASVFFFQVRGIQQTVARQSHHKRTPDFHDKYGNAVLASGATFCIAVWAYTATQIGIEWNLSPVGRVTPKEWRDQ
uniref:Cytochrome c oxidase subunit 7B, mitochondrial n=2 Tax=Equus TaxID=9789 RepID=A0A9L0S3W6_HORSE